MKIKKIIIVFFLLSVFAVGTINFAETVDAAKWKKFDTGTFKDNGFKGFKEKMAYTSYIKDSKNIKMDFHGFKKSNNKKTYVYTMYISKTGKKIKIFAVVKGKKTKPTYANINISAKKFYKIIVTEMKKN